MRDPGEKNDLADDPAAAAPLRAARDVALRAFAPSLPGLWAAVRGRGSRGRIEGRFRYSGPFTRLVPFFPRDQETISFSKDEVFISLIDDGSVGAWLVPDRSDLAVVSVQASAEGVRLLPVAQTEPVAAGWSTWVTNAKKRPGSKVDVDEQVRRLRALGYLQ